MLSSCQAISLRPASTSAPFQGSGVKRSTLNSGGSALPVWEMYWLIPATQESITGNGRRAEDFRERPTGDAPLHFHLPEALLRVDEAERFIEIKIVARV